MLLFTILLRWFSCLSLRMKSSSVTIQMKATQYFPVVLFIMLHKVVLTFESVDKILKCDIQMKATEQYFPVVLFSMLYKVVLTFESVDKILKCDIQMKATEQYFPVVLFITLYKVVLTFESVTILMQDLAHLSSDSVCLLITVLENKMWKGWVLFCVNAVPTYFEKKNM